MWDAIKEAIKTTAGTVRFLTIVLVLVATAIIAWHVLGSGAPGLFAAVSRLIH